MHFETTRDWANEMYRILHIQDEALYGDLVAPHMKKIMDAVRELQQRMDGLEK